MALSAKHIAFVEEYLSTFNATEAYARVYRPKSRTTAGVNGHLLLKKAKITEAIKQRLSESAMSAEEVLMRLAQHGRGDMGQWLTDDGAIDIGAMKRDGATHLIHKVKRTERSGETAEGGTWSHVTVDVELHPAQSALALLGKHHKLFTDVSETKAEVEIVDATDPRERIRSRIAGIAQRNAMGRSPERPDPAGGDSP